MKPWRAAQLKGFLAGIFGLFLAGNVFVRCAYAHGKAQEAVGQDGGEFTQTFGWRHGSGVVLARHGRLLSVPTASCASRPDGCLAKI
jgi:hypothetical protein